MQALQILAAFLLLLNKILVYKKRPIGWILGLMGCILITIYFYRQMVFEHKGNLWIMIVYDIGLSFLMIYGFINSTPKLWPKLHALLKLWNLYFKSIVAFITLVFCFKVYTIAQTEQTATLQLLGAIGGLAGTLFLAFNATLTNKIGWVIYFITHCIVAALMVQTDSPWICLAQIASAIVSVFGFVSQFKEEKSDATTT